MNEEFGLGHAAHRFSGPRRDRFGETYRCARRYSIARRTAFLIAKNDCRLPAYVKTQILVANHPTHRVLGFARIVSEIRQCVGSYGNEVFAGRLPRIIGELTLHILCGEIYTCESHSFKVVKGDLAAPFLTFPNMYTLLCLDKGIIERPCDNCKSNRHLSSSRRFYSQMASTGCLRPYGFIIVLHCPGEKYPRTWIT